MNGISLFFSNIGNYFVDLYFSKNYLQAGAIIVLVFLLVITLAQIRHHYVDWSIKGGVVGIFFGFLLALILEGFLLIGGRTAVTEFLGWENAPKPIKTALDMGRLKLINVLGVSDQIPFSVASENPTSEDAIDLLQNLDPSETKKVKALICEP